MIGKLKNELLQKAYSIESSIMHVCRVYAGLISYKFTSAKADMGMSYNTLENSLKDTHHPKLEVLVRIVRGLFPEEEEEFIPGFPRELSSHLCRDEMSARIFSAALDDNPKRIKAVANLMLRLAAGDLPTLSELNMMKKDLEKDK